MKRILILLAIVGLGVGIYQPALAHTTHECEHELTIQSLYHCVHHAAEHGIIDNEGVAQSLLAKLSAAQAALDRGRIAAAVNELRAFIYEVEAQSGVHIDSMHAEHMIMHAEMVIEELLS